VSAVSLVLEDICRAPTGWSWRTAIMRLRGSWAAFAVSVMAGVIALFMLTGNIDAKHHMDDPSKAKELKIGNSIYVADIQVPFAIQLILFMLGTALFFVFGILGSCEGWRLALLFELRGSG
jgi:hypothetical protein